MEILYPCSSLCISSSSTLKSDARKQFYLDFQSKPTLGNHGANHPTADQRTIRALSNSVLVQAPDQIMSIDEQHHHEEASTNSDNVPDTDQEDIIDRFALELQECTYALDLFAGELVHVAIITSGLDSDRYLCNLLMSMYGSFGSIEAAEVVFHKIPSPNVYSWNILIGVYAKNGNVHKAKIAFDNMSKRNVASWNSVISAFSQNGYCKEALKCYIEMMDEGFTPDLITFISALDACAGIGELDEGVRIHSLVIDHGYSSNIVICTALINMYGQCGRLETAKSLFQTLPEHDVMSWSAMMAAYVKNKCYIEAMDMFHYMHVIGLRPSRATFLTVVDACCDLQALDKGYEIHAILISDDLESDIIVRNALINMYAKCQSPLDANVVFCKMLERNVITWSTIITAHADNGLPKEALGLFHQMQRESVNPNSFTYSMVLSICTNMNVIDEGLMIHHEGICHGVEIDAILAVALINMYGRFGMVDDARAIFENIAEPEMIAWNALVSAYVLNNEEEEAWKLFQGMKSRGIVSENSTFKLTTLKSRQEIKQRKVVCDPC